MTLTGSDVEILLDLDTDLNNSDTCEHSGHGRRADRHSDDSGTWLVATFCPCGEPEYIILCGKFRAWCFGKPDAVISCNDCGRNSSPSATYQWIREL